MKTGSRTKELPDNLSGPATHERAVEIQRMPQLPENRRHRHFGGASVSVLAFHGYAQARLGKPGSVHSLGTQFGKHSSFRLGHNLGTEARGATDKKRLGLDGRVQPTNRLT